MEALYVGLEDEMTAVHRAMSKEIKVIKTTNVLNTHKTFDEVVVCAPHVEDSKINFHSYIKGC